MRKVIATLAVAALACTTVWGDCGSCGADKEGECSASCCLDALADFPKMIYKISDHETVCAESAAKIAEHHEGEAMKFIVAEKVFEDKVEAIAALADEAEKFVADFAAPQKCEVSGTTTIGGQKTECNVMASKMEDSIKEAMALVSMSFKVGDETCSCPMKAASLAKESGETQHYVVGEAETCCPVDARIKLAAAKYKAALEAIANLEADAETVGTES